MPFLDALDEARGWLGAAEGLPGLRVDCVRVARLVRERRARTVGMLPADDDVAVPAVAVHLAHALSETAAGPAAVLDGDGSWTAAAAGRIRDAPRTGGVVAATWLRENLALLAVEPGEPGTTLDRLRAAIAASAEWFAHVVVDLTGFDHLGEHLAACEVLDGVILVARSGQTRARDVQRSVRDLPEARFLGILLTGM